MKVEKRFFAGIVSGDADVVLLGLADGRNTKDEEGNSPLIVAVKNKKDSIVKILVENGCDINQTIENGWTPLYCAVYHRHLSTTNLLISLGADVFKILYINNWVGNALTYATENYILDLITVLSTSIFNKTFTLEQTTEMFTSIKQGDKERVTQIINKLEREDVRKMRDKNGFSPLIFASLHKRDVIVELLLDHKFDVDELVIGWTALFAAVRERSITTVTLLLNRSANPDVWLFNNECNGSALFWAVQQGQKEISELLIQHSGKINIARKEDNVTPLYIACSQGRDEIVSLLLERGANPNIITSDGSTALLIAVKNGYSKVVKHLLSYSWINQSNYDGSTPLHFAAEIGSVEIALQLLCRGAAVNQAETGREQRVPLHYAVEGGHHGVVKLLLEHHADKERIDRKRETPLQIAKRMERGEIIDLFNKNRMVSEDVLNNLLDHVKMSATINNENRELIKRSMGLMQAISKTKCPTCIAILPSPKEKNVSIELLKELVYDKFDLHILCEAEEEAHFTGEFYPYDKLEAWMAQIMPFIRIGLTIVQVASIAVAGANIIPPIKAYMEEVGLGNTSSILNTVYNSAKLVLNLKSELDFSSADDAVQALESAARELTESDKRSLANFLSNRSPELRQRGVMLPDGTMTFKYLCKRHYAQYDQAGAKIPGSPSYPCKPGFLNFLTIHVSGVDSDKAKVEIKVLLANMETSSINSKTKDFHWTSAGLLKVSRINWLLDAKVTVRGKKTKGVLGTTSFNLFDLMEQMKVHNSIRKEFLLFEKGKQTGKIAFNILFDETPESSS